MQIEETVRNVVMRYGSRIWKLRVMQAEIKLIIRFIEFIRSSKFMYTGLILLSKQLNYACSYMHITNYSYLTSFDLLVTYLYLICTCCMRTGGETNANLTLIIWFDFGLVTSGCKGLYHTFRKCLSFRGFTLDTD